MPDTSSTSPTLLWLRRDLRLADHPGWHEALAHGGPVIPVFIRDPLFDEMTGAAASWRMGRALDALGQALEKRGSRLILRHGEALEVLEDLARQTGAQRIVWSRAYDGRQIDRDTKIKAALAEAGLDPVSVNASLLFEPWTVETKSGGPYRVYSPFWRAVRDRDVGACLAEPGDLSPPAEWPRSDSLDDWSLGADMRRGAAVVADFAVVGEGAARDRLDDFVDNAIGRYKRDRDVPALPATSGLSENLAYGEISPRQIWHAGQDALAEAGQGDGAEHFLKELVWREFAYHLLYHYPEIETRNWRPEWENFPWRGDNDDAERWRRGMTGVEMVDAAMREMYVTGTMHNRARMLTASFLTKHLMTDWRVGEAWFRDCLIDWDVASNAMGWQWVAGSGPDAAPYFRVFNPDTQAEKFDKDGRYRDRWLAEGRSEPHPDALRYFDAVPRSWDLSPDADYPAPVISLAAGRERALDAYSTRMAAE
ncbi:deoxyribodipyrimidine photo-lyase [Rhodobacteraceae bacterium NNCM2]|nr:deoxyribodipyrimidine photo-lyase [Coraliihabitans acroporae]